jgi:stage V sporulation protein G
MEITQIRVFPVQEEKLKAFVSIILDDCFVVSDIKIIEGGSGLFVSMPSKKRKNGTFRDIAHPLNNETRRHFEEQIISKYREVLADSGGDAGIPLRRLGKREGEDADGESDVP